MTPPTGAPAPPGHTDVPYLSCGACGLSVRSRNPLTERAYCPRCGARGRFEPLQRSVLPRRLEPAPHLHNGDGSAAQINDGAHELCQPANIARSVP